MRRVRVRFLAVLIFLAPLASGCGMGGSCSDCGPGWVVRFVVTDPAGVPLPAFRVVHGAYDGQYVSEACRAGVASSGTYGCQADGSVLVGGSAGREVPQTVTTEAHGFRTARDRKVNLDGDPPTTTIAMEPLPAFQSTKDYRTGFVAATGLDDFIAMSYPASDDLGSSYSVKFYVDGIDEMAEVYFQDTRRWFTHVDFVKNVLGKAVTQDQFEERTYRNAQRDAIAGTLIYRPDLAIQRKATIDGIDLGGVAVRPLTLEFFPSDHLTPEHALLAYLLIQERLAFSPLDGLERRLFYLPAGDTQEAAVASGADAFARDGALWLRRMDVFQGLTVQYLNPGTAYGTLRVLTPENLDQAVISFRDVLVLTRLPNKVPVSGGTITGELQTPLAHVNVAARARGTPNMALVGAPEDPRVAPFVGKLVKLVVKPGGFTLEEATLDEATKFWTESADKPRLVPTADLARDDLPGFDTIGFDDRDAFGPKASNVAELSHPDVLGVPTAPTGFAVPFHSYDAFLDSPVDAAACAAARVSCNEHGGTPGACATAGGDVCLPGQVGSGETLRAWIHRVLGDATLATDSSLRWAAMDVLRSLFCLLPMDAAFAAALDARVTGLFAGAKVRLRSSANAEDLPGFSGAGLYTSVSANGAGEPASRRICEVWASTWNWNAVEERAFWNVDQEATRMAVAVETSYPDEAANGVLITQNIADPMSRGMYVNVQAGETSVTNPSNGETPEVLSIIAAPDGIQVARQRFSSMSPHAPILEDDEIAALYWAAAKVQAHFAPLYCEGDPKCDPDAYALDLEFKFVGPGRELVIKQVRPYHAVTAVQ